VARGPETPDARLHRLLKRELGALVRRTKRGTWTTTSNLPHEIRIHEEAGVALVRVSAGMVLDVKPSKALLKELNALNTRRAFSKRIIIDRKVLLVAEMPVASLRKGDLEQLVSMVFCLARLDAPLVAAHGGKAVTEPPPALAPDLDSMVESWPDVLRASGTATARELAVWLDGLGGCDCWIDHDKSGVTVVIQGIGTVSEYPFRLEELRRAAEDFKYDEDEKEDDDEDAGVAEVYNPPPFPVRDGGLTG
jgi:hypothetical protein